VSWNNIKLLSLLVLFNSFAVGASQSDSDKLNTSEDVLIIKALLDEQRGDFVQSRRMYEALYGLTGKKEYLLQEAKDTLVQKADPKHSINNILDWIKRHPLDRDTKLFRMLVALYIQSGALVDAEDVADEYLTKNAPIEDMIAVASLKLELNKPKEALTILENAYKTNHDSKVILQIAIIWERDFSKPERAISLLEKHIKNYDNNESVGTYFKLIELYAKEKNLDKVLSLYKKLYQRDPQKYFLQKIIEISLYRKDIDGVIKFLEQSKDNEEILYTFYKEKNQFDKAIEIAKKLYKKTGQGKWLAEEGMLYYEKSRKAHKFIPESLKKMQELLEKAISMGVNDSIYLNYYGYTLIDHDLNIDRGIKLVKQALEKSPTNTYYLDSLAWGLYKKGKCQKAYEIMEKVVKKEGLGEDEIKTHWDLIKSCKSIIKK